MPDDKVDELVTRYADWLTKVNAAMGDPDISYTYADFTGALAKGVGGTEVDGVMRHGWIKELTRYNDGWHEVLVVRCDVGDEGGPSTLTGYWTEDWGSLRYATVMFDTSINLWVEEGKLVWADGSLD